MRVTSRNAALALINDGKFKSANTETRNGVIFLFGSPIARKIDDDTYEVTLAGYNTPTTKERVNSLLECLGYRREYHHKKGVLHFGDIPAYSTDLITLKRGHPPLIVRVYQWNRR